MTVFTLGSIGFNSGTPDGDGLLWYGYVDGWDLLENRVEDYNRPAQHGAITTTNLYNSRGMTVFGTAEGQDSTDYWIAKNKINGETNALTQFAAPELILTHTEDVSKQMVVYRTSLRTTCIEQKHLQFELTLRADDPFKYASTPTTLATSGTAVNAGNATTYPTFTLTGSGTPTLTLGSRTVNATAALPAGTVIDMGRITVLSGTTNYFGNMNPASQFFGFAPGNNTVSSTVAGTWSWRSAWL